MNPRLQRLVSEAQQLSREMWRWQPDDLTRRRSWFYALLRVVAITWAGLKENRIIIRAAALSFSSLLGLGPVIALTVLASGFVLNQSEPGMAQETIEQIISYVAPQVNLSTEEAAMEGGNQGLNELIARFIEASQSGTVGLGGTLILVLIVIQLFITIEDAFNDIWAVSRGRKLLTRVVLYWTIITLGAVLVFAGLALFVTKLISLNTQFASFAEGIPGSETIGSWIATYGAKIGSLLLITTVLALFYRFIPNTEVEWKAAIVGGIFAVTCFSLNNAFASLYIERVAMQRTLYGSLGILPILMIGLYIFWLCLLLGGRLSFAVQNARFRSGRVAWEELSHASQESLCLLLFIQIARRFQECGEAYTTSQLAEANQLPRPLANAAMTRLEELGFASALPAKESDAFATVRYQPARPLGKIRLAEFQRRFETFGETPDEERFDAQEPLLREYRRRLADARQESFKDQTLESALQEFPPASK